MTTVAIIGQTVLLNRQAAILEQQADMQSFQLRIATRPVLKVEVGSTEPEGPYRDGPLTITNAGRFDIANIRLSFVHFAFIKDHGWNVNATSEFRAEEVLAPKDVIRQNLSVLKPMFGDAGVQFGSKPTLQITLVLVRVERPIDARQFLHVEPFVWDGDSAKFGAVSGFSGKSGPLAKVCGIDSIAFALFEEYLKRTPIWASGVEVLNHSSELGRNTECLLGGISWR